MPPTEMTSAPQSVRRMLTACEDMHPIVKLGKSFIMHSTSQRRGMDTVQSLHEQ